MKRVLTLATAGVFSMGLVLLPMVANAAEPAASGGKDTKPVAASTTAATPAMHGGPATAAPVKKDDPKVTVAPTTGTPATGTSTTGTTAVGTMAKPPVKTGS